MGIEFNNDQIYALYAGENWYHKGDRQVFEIVGPAGSGKCESIETPIPTPNGFIKMGDLKVGDYVFNEYGDPVKILGVYDQGEKDAYEVEFEDKRTVICNDEHLWGYYTDSHGKKKYQVGTLKEIMDRGIVHIDKQGHIDHPVSIPNNMPVKYSTKEYDVDPYVIGSFLGNGCCTLPALTLSSNDIENVEEVTKLLDAKKYHKNSTKNYLYSFRLKDEDKTSHNKNMKTKTVFKTCQELIGNSHEKRIPEKYMLGDIDQRWSLIQGLFDTDGCITSAGKRYNVSYSSSNENLIYDIKKVLSSLGIMSSVTFNDRDRNDCITREYNLHVKADNTIKPKFFRLSRKKNIAIEATKIKSIRDYSKVKIYDIRKMDKKIPMRCIYIDSPNHLYLTNNYVVTHNTSIICALIDRLGISMDHVLFVAFMGKAAAQMARHGLPARTAHSAFYDYVKVPARDENGKLIIKDNGKIKKIPDFVLKDFIQTTAGKTVKLIVIDEGSQITDKMAKDILSFGIPTIVLGDLNQLPPVFGNSYFLKHPDVELHQIMRQKENDPIVIISRAILAGERLRYGVYGKTSIISKRDLTDYQLRHADIILTGTNRLRYNVNNYVRENIKKIKMLDYPHIGEKVICRKNNWKRCIGDNIFLTNGTAGFVDNIYKSSFNGKTFSIDFRPDFTNDVFKDVTFDYKHMYAIPGEIEEESFDSIYNDKMEFAYAITTHASQGSQYPNVTYLREQFMRDPEDQKRLDYTAVTRAMDAVTIIQ